MKKEKHIKVKKNPIFYKHKIVKITNNKGEEHYEVIWFIDYGTKDQQILSKKFDKENEAFHFSDFKRRLVRQYFNEMKRREIFNQKLEEYKEFI